MNEPTDMNGHWNCGVCGCSWELKSDANACCDSIHKDCLSKQAVREVIPHIIKLFAAGNDDVGIWGHDTCLYNNMEEAIKAVEKELNL